MLNEAACIITQSVPFDTRVAQLPDTSVKIAVPAAPPPCGTTLLDAETRFWAWLFWNVRYRPEYVAADGSVTVQVDPDLLLMIHVSLVATVKSAVLVTGAVEDGVNARMANSSSGGGDRANACTSLCTTANADIDALGDVTANA